MDTTLSQLITYLFITVDFTILSRTVCVSTLTIMIVNRCSDFASKCQRCTKMGWKELRLSMSSFASILVHSLRNGMNQIVQDPILI